MKKIALITLLFAIIGANNLMAQRTEFTVSLETPNNDSIFIGYQYALLETKDSSMITGNVIEENPFKFKQIQKHFL